MDPETVIYLGHISNKPLIRASGELVDGLEPHAINRLPVVPVRQCTAVTVIAGVYPGWCRLGSTRRVHTGYPARSRIEAYFMEYEV